jgi:acyl carrier protein
MALSEQEILKGLAEIINSVTELPVDKVEIGKTFTDDLEIDSLDMMQIVVDTEEKFGVRIPDDKVKDLKTVGDALDYIQSASVPA